MITHSTIARLVSSGGALVLLFAVLAISAFAQSNKGEVKGTVKDQNGAVVQNAQVTITNTGTNAARTVSTGDDGTYDVPLLEPGTYRVEIVPPAALNLQKAVQENVMVQTAQTLPLDITLQAGGIGAQVTVTAEPRLVE